MTATRENFQNPFRLQDPKAFRKAPSDASILKFENVDWSWKRVKAQA